LKRRQYQNLHRSEISKTTLEKWSDSLTKEELDEISWSIDELKNSCNKLQEKLNNDSESA